MLLETRVFVGHDGEKGGSAVRRLLAGRARLGAHLREFHSISGNFATISDYLHAYFEQFCGSFGPLRRMSRDSFGVILPLFRNIS